MTNKLIFLTNLTYWAFSSYLCLMMTSGHSCSLLRLYLRISTVLAKVTPIIESEYPHLYIWGRWRLRWWGRRGRSTTCTPHRWSCPSKSGFSACRAGMSCRSTDVSLTVSTGTSVWNCCHFQVSSHPFYPESSGGWSEYCPPYSIFQLQPNPQEQFRPF